MHSSQKNLKSKNPNHLKCHWSKGAEQQLISAENKASVGQAQTTPHLELAGTGQLRWDPLPSEGQAGLQLCTNQLQKHRQLS